MTDLLGDIDVLKARWMTGGSTTGQGPADWRSLDETARLALVGQYMRVATHPAAAAMAPPRAPLPKLDVPPLDETLRSLFRRVLAEKFVTKERTLMVIRLLAARGYAAHPGDWLPVANDRGDIPAIYDPWLNWISDEATPTGVSSDETVTADNWDDWYPAARVAAMERLLKADRHAARALIAEKAGTLAAEQRLRMLMTLENGLVGDDAELLKSFDSDRSSKVQALCNGMLGRLGLSDDAPEALDELVGLIEVGTTGLLRRQPKIEIPKLKSRAQDNTFRVLMGQATLIGLSKRLSMTPEEVVTLWPIHRFGDALASMVAASGTTPVVRVLAERILEQGNPHDAFVLLERLAPDDRIDLAEKALKRDALTLDLTVNCLLTSPGVLPYEAIARATSDILTRQNAKSDQAYHARKTADEGLINLGLIADRDASERLITDLTKQGFVTADPALTMLRLNAAL